MSVAAWVMFVLFFVWSFMGMPIGHAMIASGIVYLFMTNQDLGLVASQSLNGLYGSFVLLAVPLFILAAEIMNASKMTDRLFGFANVLVGRLKGGLAQVNIVASVIFSGMSGSALADAAGPGKLEVDMMVKAGYKPGFAAALSTTSAIIGPIIPPSIPMVHLWRCFGHIDWLSLHRRYRSRAATGIRPEHDRDCHGSLQGFSCRTKADTQGGNGDDPRCLACLVSAYHPAWRHILRGRYTHRGRSSCMPWSPSSLHSSGIAHSACEHSTMCWSDSARSTSIVAITIAGALVMNWIVASEQIPETISRWMTSLEMSPALFMLMVTILFLITGAFLDTMLMLLIMVPMLMPTVDCTRHRPRPFRRDLSGQHDDRTGNAPNGRVGVPDRRRVRDQGDRNHKRAVAFLIVLIALLFVLVYVPELTLWLPMKMGYEPVGNFNL